MRRRVYMSSGSDLVRWVGELRQLDIHNIDRSNFNAVAIHDKLSVWRRTRCPFSCG
jgi:hypothetical protein